MFTKELLAKYINSFQEIFSGKKNIIGPHIVVRGSQKNYSHLINYNFSFKPNNIWYEDFIAKSILFKSAEQIYGIKPNSIGDMRYITVPYTISILNYHLNYKLNLHQIWLNQDISENLRSTLLDLMTQVEWFIKTNAPGSLYGEWAKKIDCWNLIKEHEFTVDYSKLSDDIVSKTSISRSVLLDDDLSSLEKIESLKRIKSIPIKLWLNIEDWGRLTSNLTQYQVNIAYNIRQKLKNNRALTDIEIQNAENIIDVVFDKNPKLLLESDEPKVDNNIIAIDPDYHHISIDLVNRMIEWDKKHKVLKLFKFKYLKNIVDNNSKLTDKAKHFINLSFKELVENGFK